MKYEAAYRILEEFVEMLTNHDRALKPKPDYQIKSEWSGRLMVEVASEVLTEARVQLTEDR